MTCEKELQNQCFQSKQLQIIESRQTLTDPHWVTLQLRVQLSEEVLHQLHLLIRHGEEGEVVCEAAETLVPPLQEHSHTHTHNGGHHHHRVSLDPRQQPGRCCRW